jgi:hypothetical protein
VARGLLDAGLVPERWQGRNPGEGRIANGGSPVIAPDGGCVAEP